MKMINQEQSQQVKGGARRFVKRAGCSVRRFVPKGWFQKPNFKIVNLKFIYYENDQSRTSSTS